MRILIVEDERALCDTLAKSLKQKGYEVDACYDGDSALDWLLAEKYDLILLDLNLPGRDGMELLKTLRERDRETRVLILSARSRISDKVEGLDCGANDYLVKPFHLEELAARVRSQLENGWEPTMALLEQAVAEGVMRPVSLPVLRQMITASIESFLADRSLAESGVQYVAVLEEMISILLEGVLPR